MRLDEIQPNAAAEQRVDRLKNNAAAEADRANKLKVQANAEAERLRIAQSHGRSSGAKKSGAGSMIKPHS